MSEFAAVAALLGISDELGSSPSPFALIETIEDGLPLRALDRVARHLAPDDTEFKYRLISNAALDRRSARGRLTSTEGARLVRVARLWCAALDVWQNDYEARRFLFQSHPMLEDQKPIEVAIRSEFGAPLVFDILNQLRYGSAA